MELREKIANIIRTRVDGRGTAGGMADAILSIPEIRDALELRKIKIGQMGRINARIDRLVSEGKIRSA